MGISELSKIAEQYLSENRPDSTPVSIILSAGSVEQEIISTTLKELSLNPPKKSIKPGLLIIGETAKKEFLYQNHTALDNIKVLLTCSEAIQKKAICEVRNFGGTPISKPLIKLKLTQNELFMNLKMYDYLVMTSPSAVRALFELIETAKIDLRQIPKLAVCGPGTYNEFCKHGLFPEIVAKNNFGVEGFLTVASEQIPKGSRILRLRSDKATQSLSDSLTKIGLQVTDHILYNSVNQSYQQEADYNAVVFASSSAVKAFAENWDINNLTKKQIVVIGKPTAITLQKILPKISFLTAIDATIESSIKTLAYHYINERLKKMNSVIINYRC